MFSFGWSEIALVVVIVVHTSGPGPVIVKKINTCPNALHSENFNIATQICVYCIQYWNPSWPCPVTNSVQNDCMLIPTCIVYI